VVVSEEGRGSHGGSEWEECSAGDVISGTTVDSSQPWSVGERWE